MTKLYRILGKRGRITIPYEMRKRVGFTYNDVLSFTEAADGKTVIVKSENICDNCNGTRKTDTSGTVTLLDFLNSLTVEEKKCCPCAFVDDDGKIAEKRR